MVQTLPANYFLNEHNREFYINEKIHEKLPFLDLLPMVNNETGEFTQFITSAAADTETENPRGINEGVNFAEINFGEPSIKRGSTLAKGFKFSWTSKVVRKGRLNANMRIWLSKAVSKMAQYYNGVFANGLMDGATATAPQLSDWQDESAIDPIADELYIIDAYAEEEYGFTPKFVYLNNKDYLARELYLKSLDKVPTFQLQYINYGTKIQRGDALVMPDEPVASVEKYTDPNYSTIRKGEMVSLKTGKQLTNVPESFINVWYPPVMTKPDVFDCFLWAEAAVNVLEGNGLMKLNLTGN
ncbi:MAG: hypothetical protein J6M91_09290 [Methanobrevibacter sp.]|nr:hypothetical protein [Methanobrevibacter sp.]